ncbi:MAG: hypothetical protein ACK4MG_13975, partial [Aquabacterium sp.]
NGEKLSKQNGAAALDLRDPVAALRQAGVALGLALGDATLRPGITVADWLALAVPAWQALLLRWEAASVNAG